MSEIRFIDLFAGIGGFRLGLQRSSDKYRCVWSNDINKHANQIYTKRFGEENHHSGDIREIEPKNIPDHDLLCAGFPCQAFSVAGQRHGFNDTRGTLFFEIARIIQDKRPTLLLLENVKGLLNHDEGFTFQIIIESLEELGYLVEWQVLNSKHFGVPQNRERVFIIGHLRGRSTHPIFPITITSRELNQWDTRKQIASTLQSPGHASGNYRGMNMIAVLTPDRPEKHQNGRRFKEPGEPMFTLTGQDQHGVMEIANCVTDGWLMDTSHHSKPMCEYRIRRLTPIECERLQGFPDKWTQELSDTQRYRTLGNAVTVNVIQYLGELILSSFSKSLRIEEK